MEKSNGTFPRITKIKNTDSEGSYYLTDLDLSLKAKGLLSVLLSLPDDWNFSKAGLAKIIKEGRTVLENTLKELKNHGYLKIEKKRDEGRFVYVYYIFEEPHTIERL